MMRAIAGEIVREVAARNSVRQQIIGAAADEAFHLVNGERRQTALAAHVIDAARDRAVAVGKGAVEIEEDGGVGTKSIRHGSSFFRCRRVRQRLSYRLPVFAWRTRMSQPNPD